MLSREEIESRLSELCAVSYCSPDAYKRALTTALHYLKERDKARAANEEISLERDDWKDSALSTRAEVERLREALEKIVRKTEPGPYRSFAEKNRIQSLHDLARQALRGGDG